MKRRLQFDPCKPTSSSGDQNQTINESMSENPNSTEYLVDPKSQGDLIDMDWTINDDIEEYPNYNNERFYPGETYYENDVTTDEECDDHNREYGHLELFFHTIGEPKHIPLFEKHKVTLAQLLDFDEEDLVNIGIELVGERKKILDSIAEWHSEQWKPTSLNDMTSKKMLSAPGIYISLNDINKHIDYIGASFRYISKVINKKPEILQLGRDYCGIRRIADEVDDLCVTHKNAGKFLVNLRSEVARHVNNPDNLPPNEIDAKYVMRAKLVKNIVPMSIIAISMIVGLGIAVKFHFYMSAKN